MAPAKRTARPSIWPVRGRDARAVWGSCEGAETYETWVDLKGPGFRCTCPSREQPCRHALGLLLMAAELPELVEEAPQPAALSAWLKRRDAPAKPTSDAKKAKAAAARRAKRVAKVSGGMQALELWLSDQVRLGLSSLQSQPHDTWRELGGRLEDAQLKALPELLLRLEERVGVGPGWPQGALDTLGRLALLVEAWGQRERLSAPMQAELRTRIGWPVREAEALAEGEGVVDRWWVLGQRSEELRWSEGLHAEHTWLRGERSGRWGLLLRFEHESQRARLPVTPPPALGELLEGELVFAPAAYPQRALFRAPPTRREGPPPEPDCDGLEALLQRDAEALAASPWVERVPAFVAALTPTQDRDGAWWMLDQAGAALPLAGRPPWQLLALSGGHPTHVALEWDGEALHPMGSARPLAAGVTR